MHQPHLEKNRVEINRKLSCEVGILVIIASGFIDYKYLKKPNKNYIKKT